MAIPDYPTLMLPVLTVAAEGEMRVAVAAQTIADRLGLSEEPLPSGKQRLLHNRVHWAKFYMSNRLDGSNPFCSFRNESRSEKGMRFSLLWIAT